MRVLGVDPGLTRCGIGVVERIDGKLSLVDLGVIRTPKESDLAERLLQLDSALGDWIKRAKDRKSTRLNSSHVSESRMPSSA